MGWEAPEINKNTNAIWGFRFGDCGAPTHKYDQYKFITQIWFVYSRELANATIIPIQI